MLIDFTPLCLLVMTLGVVIMLFGPRRWILPVFFLIPALVSFGPRVMIFGQNFMVYRVLLMFAWLRILTRGDHRGLSVSPLDKALAAFYIWTIIADTLLLGTSDAFVFQMATSLYDGFGIYYLTRIYLRDADDILRLVKAIAAVAVVVGGFMFVEYVTRRSPLDALGAFNESVQVRSGRLRCQGAFGVPITAGTFGAVLLPLFIACWWQRPSLRRWAVPGCIASTIITVASGSGGPVLSYVASVGGMAAWFLRERMRTVRRGVCFVLVALALVMQAPVWFLIARIQVVPGASSYHRAKVVDAFVQHFSEWWLLGVETTEEWGWEMVDVANQYCVVAKHGGLLALILFTRVLVVGFRQIGVLRHSAQGDFSRELLIWSVGVMLFSHAVSFVGISYFDQMRVFWSICLGLIASLPALICYQTEAQEAELSGLGSARIVPT